MARSKNATALFEVIHTAKKPPKSSTTVSVPTPKWWSKSKPTAPAAPKHQDAPEAAGKQGSWLAAAARRGVAPTPVNPVEPTDAAETAEWDPTENAHARMSAPHYTPHEPAADDSDDRETTGHSVDAGSAEVAEPVAPKPKFAERFAERFAAKRAAAAAAEVMPVEPVARTESSDALPAYEETSDDMDVVEPAMTVPAKKQKPSKAVKDDVVAVDRAAKEIQLRLSYAGMVAIGFIFLLVVVIAFLVGSRSGILASDTQDDFRKTNDPNAASTGLMVGIDSLRPSTPATPAESSSANAGSNRSSSNSVGLNEAGANKPEATPTNPGPVRPDVLGLTRHPKLPPVASLAADVQHPSAPVNTTREVGSQYVVVQSYAEQQLAQKASDYLNKAGVECSVVQGLDGWAPADWYCVVGSHPFATNDPTLPQYEQIITSLGQKFSNKAYNRFEPKPYTWRADSEHQTAGE